MATIGELIINLNANTASFVTDLNRVKNLSFDTAAQVQRSFELIGTAALGMLATAGAALAATVLKSVEFEVQMGHLAQAAGTTTETMSGLAFAFKQMGLDAETGAKAMEFFAKNLYAFETGTSKGAIKAVFEEIGLDPASIKMSDDALRVFADHISKMNDGFAKTAEIKTVMGKGGAVMAAFLNEGSAGIDKFIAAANRLGVVVTQEQFQAAEAFKQNMLVMEAALTGLEMKITNAVIPALLGLKEHLADTAKGAGSFAAGAEAILALQSPGALYEYLQKSAELQKAAAESAAKLTAARKDWAAADAAAAKAEEALKKSVESIISTYKTEIATMGMSNLQVTEYKLRADAAKLGLDGWLKSELLIIETLDKKKKWLEQLAMLDNSRLDAEKKNFLADKLKIDAEDLEILKQKADLVMQMANVAQPLTIAPGASDAFTASINEQITALKYAEATFGMTSEQIAIFNLRQLDGSAAAEAMIPALEAEQAKLKGMTDAASLAAKSAEANARAWKTFGEVANRSLDDLIFSGKKFTQVLADITKALGEMFLKWALFGFGQSNAGGGGGLFGALFGGLSGLFGGGGGGAPTASFGDLSGLGMISPLMTFAAGGDVAAGQSIIVGESGPEIFRPDTAGTIIPAGGGGPQIHISYQIDARGSSITEEQFRRSLAESENRAVHRALLTSREMQLRTA